MGSQCYLSRTQVNVSCLTQHQPKRLVLDLPILEGVDLGGWLHTEMLYLPAVTHPSIYSMVLLFLL